MTLLWTKSLKALEKQKYRKTFLLLANLHGKYKNYQFFLTISLNNTVVGKQIALNTIQFDLVDPNRLAVLVVWFGISLNWVSKNKIMTG